MAPTPFALAHLDGLKRLGFVAQIIDDNIRTGLGQPQSRRPADAARRTGDDRGLAGKKIARQSYT